MNLKGLFEFPTILIVVGMVLLVAAVIVGIFAYKKPSKEQQNDKSISNNELTLEESLEKIKEVAKEKKEDIVEEKLESELEKEEIKEEVETL